MRQLLLIAVRNLLAHRRRSLLLGSAIGGVTAVLVVLIALSSGMRATLLESALTLMSGHVNVGGFFKVAAGQGAPTVTGYPALLELVRREVPELDYVTHRGRGWAKVVSDTGSMQLVLGGIDVAEEPGFRKVVQMRHGRIDDLAEKGTMLLFESQAKKLAVQVGDVVTISAPTFRGVNNTVDVRVVAIAADVGMMSSFAVFMHAQTLRDLYQLKDDTTGAIHLYLKDMSAIPAVQQRLREKLAAAGYALMDNDPRAYFMKFEVVSREGWTGQKLDITTWEDEVSFVRWVLVVLTFLTVLLTVALLVVVSVGIMNTLWIAIRERTREIGTLRAIGMQRRRVLLMFLTEALLLALGGTLGGAAAGVAFSEAVNAAHLRAPDIIQAILLTDEWYFKVEPLYTVGAVAFITTCAMLVSLVPSFLAARMKPVTAMHHIG